MLSLLARTAHPAIAMGVLIVCGNLPLQAAAAASACAPASTAKADIVGVLMRNLFRIATSCTLLPRKKRQRVSAACSEKA